MNTQNVWKWSWLFIIIVSHVMLTMVMLNTNGDKIKSNIGFGEVVSDLTDGYKKKLTKAKDTVVGVSKGLFSKKERDDQAKIKDLEAQILALKIGDKVVIKKPKAVEKKKQTASKDKIDIGTKNIKDTTDE